MYSEESPRLGAFLFGEKMNPTNSAQALSQVQSLQKTAQDPNSILANQRQQLGVNAAQDTVSGLRGAINNTTKLLNQVAPSVMGRTAGSLVTNAQANRQIQNEQAPISQNLTQEGTQYNQAQQDLSQLQDKAQTAASGIYEGQQNKLSYAQNLYNTLYQKERDAQAAAQAKAAAAEQSRQFNADLSEKRREANMSGSGSSGLSSVLGSLLGGGSSGGGGGYQMQQRSGGGFNFQSANGAATNAVGFSQAKGVPIRTLLQQMASAGDSGAKTALDYVGNDYGVNTGKLRSLEVSPNTYNATVSLLHSLGFRV
jgi:hypothetical protein